MNKILSYDEQYQNILEDILTNGVLQYNKRTDSNCLTLPCQTLRIDCTGWHFPILASRKIFVKTFVAEAYWNKFTKIWDYFMDKEGYLETAYGYRMRKTLGRDQLMDAIKTLQRDKSSRQVVISYWDASSDGLIGPKKKNIPCPFTFVINIIDGKLNFHLIIRSNDMIAGNPYDVSGHAVMMFLLASHLNVEPGVMMVSISHAHIYENHIEIAKELLSWGTPKNYCTFKPNQRALNNAMKFKRDDIIDSVKEIDRLNQFQLGLITQLK
jgi:thymidylate synthase